MDMSLNMSPNARFASLYQQPLPQDIGIRLKELFTPAAGQGRAVQVFFRADDIGRIDDNFIRMMELFNDYGVPLCPALVPQWLSRENWLRIKDLVIDDTLFCWHQHGYSHANHEPKGKKNEFGESRSVADIRGEIQSGKTALEELLGNTFYPVFTPPWNRCSQATLDNLQDLQFTALSRSINVQPSAPAGLPDLAINIDLHTRRESDPAQALENLLTECAAALKTGRMGFMLHHQRMNDKAFFLLEELFRVLREQPGVELCTFRDLFSIS